jgi:hypothetical protein
MAFSIHRERCIAVNYKSGAGPDCQYQRAKLPLIPFGNGDVAKIGEPRLDLCTKCWPTTVRLVRHGF